MSDSDEQKQPRASRGNTLLGRAIDSPMLTAAARLAPIAWIIRKSASAITRRQIGQTEAASSSLEQNIRSDLQSTLESIVRDIVDVFGYTGAMIAPYEPGDVLPVRAAYVDPNITTMDQIHLWEQQINRLLPPEQAVSLSDPSIARVYVHDSKYKNNLSVKAMQAGRPVVSDSLFDLFTPIAPEITREAIRGIQEGLGIQQVIDVPFFINTVTTGQAGSDQVVTEYVGNLFVAKRGIIDEKDEILLAAFGRQIAASILSERRRMQSESIQHLILDMQRSLNDEQKILERIVQGVVEDLGYSCGMVATFEPDDDALPIRAIYVNPQVATMDDIRAWERQVQELLPADRPLSLTDPEIARVYVHDETYKENLSVKAAQAGKPVTSERLFDLFTPIAPDISEPLIQGVQDALRIKQVIAVPFFIDMAVDGHPAGELVGDLFAATQSESFASWEIELLQAFGQQAAVGLKNARLYKQSEDRRAAGEILGRMAFSASANVHAFRNHIGMIRGNLQLLTKLDTLAKDEEMRREYLSRLAPPIMKRLNEVSEIIDRLHTPWQLTGNEPVDVNLCVHRALQKIITDDSEDWVHLSLAEDLSPVNTTPDMLTEAFRVVIKNSVEAIAEKGGQRSLSIESRRSAAGETEVLIRDNGIGIKKEHLARIFEMRWTTKSYGLGFGLFWARDYIEGLGGKIHLESVWQQGTTTLITLPAAGQAQAS